VGQLSAREAERHQVQDDRQGIHFAGGQGHPGGIP
jgi:hypothetical protein